jgi:hypothetical protein
MKPLGRKNYGSIGHLPSSRMGPGDHSVHDGQGRICTSVTRDRHDKVIVTEKLDGSNVGIAKINGMIVALGRAGHPAQSSKFEQHQLFAAWVRERYEFWQGVLQEGERLVGEWMAQAHGTRYALPLGPFAAFDLMIDDQRLSFASLHHLCVRHDIPMPLILHIGGAASVDDMMAKLHATGGGGHGADEYEGVVYRVERNGAFDFMAKWVRPDKIDGKYLPEVDGSVVEEPIWNWRPS